MRVCIWKDYDVNPVQIGTLVKIPLYPVEEEIFERLIVETKSEINKKTQDDKMFLKRFKNATHPWVLG